MPRRTITRIVDASKLPQKVRLLRHLKAVGHISNREATLDHHIVCLAKRIQELREDGVPITSHWKKHPVSGQRYTRYVLGNLAA